MHRIDELLLAVLDKGGSDLHISTDSKPIIRLHGDLVTLEDFPILTNSDTEEMFSEILNDDQKSELEQERAMSFCYEMSFDQEEFRFRANVFEQRKGWDGAFRVIPWTSHQWKNSTYRIQ